ncbi:hypothetical protein BZZ08_07148 [Streptomyces sp. MH60]|nr:hypothetical protein BZZ08_07148 [Streptomyces sp. MH60]
MARRPRVLSDGDGPATPVEQRGGEADVADGRGDAGQVGQPVDERGRDRGPLGQRDRQVTARVELLLGGDHDVRAAEPSGRQLRAQPGLGEHAGGGDQGRAAEHRARHGEQCGDPVRGHAQGEVQHVYRSPNATSRSASCGAVGRSRASTTRPSAITSARCARAAAAGSWVTITTV